MIPLPPEREDRLGVEAEARRRLGERPEPAESDAQTRGPAPPGGGPAVS